MNLILSCYNKLLQWNEIPKYLMLVTHWIFYDMLSEVCIKTAVQKQWNIF